jgi:hypothetical protein
MNNALRLDRAPALAIRHLASRQRALVGALVATAFCGGVGGCMLSVEADVPDIEVTQHDIAFAGVPHAALLGDLSTSMSFSQDRPGLDLPKGIDTSAQAVKVEFSAKSGIEDFQFLRALRVTMTPPDSSAEPIELINYERVDGATVGATLTVPSKNPVNILEQWKADSAVFNIEMAGTLPEQAWTIDMSVHFVGKLSYKF